jgi:hypothetical protein
MSTQKKTSESRETSKSSSLKDPSSEKIFHKLAGIFGAKGKKGTALEQEKIQPATMQFSPRSRSLSTIMAYLRI